MQGKKDKKVLLNVVVTLVAIYLIYLLVLYLSQRYLLFPGRSLGKTEFQIDWVSENQKVWIETSSGKVEAWLFKTTKRNIFAKTPIVIFAHGNFELIDICQLETRGFNELGVDVFLVEFPGFGRSDGSPSQQSITETYLNAYDWLLENHDIKPDQIFGFGRSLGGGAICALAKERELRALILQSTFTSVKSFARRYLVPEFISRDPFDNLSVIQSFNNPILIFHGRFDELIPYHHSEKLAQSAPQAELISYDCEHNNCPPNWDEYWKTVEKFLKKIF